MRELLSIVVPCFNEQEVFPLLREALIDVADRIESELRFEIVLIDDGSSDSTWQHILDFASTDSRVRGASLSRNFGHQMALSCGYSLAKGDAVVCMDADLQDPPEVILDMIDRWREGADIVYAVRSERVGESWFKLRTAEVFYRFIRAVGASQVRRDAGDFRLLSRPALDGLQQLGEQHRFIRGMVGWIGFETAEIHYQRHPRAAGSTQYPLKKMLRLAVDATVSFSSVPLRFTFVFAGLLSLLILSYLGFASVRYFLYGDELVRGWTSLLLSIMGFGALNLVCLGIMGEYVGRIYEQAKGRPLYLVKDEVGPDSSSQAQE
jgi:polyisoprenyl-phosphate glycosyltransferase